MRRKTAPAAKVAQNDDKKIAEISKKAGLQEIAGIEEANIIMEDNTVTQLANPKLRGSMQAKTFVLNGASTQTSIEQLSPQMRGEQSQGGGGSGGGVASDDDAAMFAKLQKTMAKIQQVMASSNISQDDLQDPAKAKKFQAALLSSGITENDLQLLQSMQAKQGGMQGNDEESAPAGNFEAVSDDAD